jgi:crossover junction endodeoxyribonuclease RuvC
MATGRTILGIDPGLRLTGYGVIATVPGGKAVLLDAGVIRLVKGRESKRPIPDRLVELETELSSIIEEHHPDVIAIEMLYSNYKHPRTAILMAHARGVILLAAARCGARLEQVAANRVKQALTGYGHTSKGGMQLAIQRYWDLAEPPEPPDVADALAVALSCAR